MGRLELQKVSTQEELQGIAAQPGSIYVGSTEDVERRKGQHERDGFSGKLYYARTANMKKAEDKLLKDLYRGKHNSHKRSNAEETDGCVCYQWTKVHLVSSLWPLHVATVAVLYILDIAL